MRQYAIMYKRPGMQEFARLEPNVNASLYDRPAVNAAIEHLRENPNVVGMAILDDGELFNLVVFDQAAEAPKSFVLEPGEPVADKGEDTT